jgi:hypothetical protein
MSTEFVVVVDHSSQLVGVHELEQDEPYSAAEGAHGRVVFVSQDKSEAVAHFDSYVKDGYRRDGGIVAPPPGYGIERP